MRTKSAKRTPRYSEAEQISGIHRIANMLRDVAFKEAEKLYGKLSADEIIQLEGPGDAQPFPRNELAVARCLFAAVLHRLPREVEAEGLLRDIKRLKRIERNRP